MKKSDYWLLIAYFWHAGFSYFDTVSSLLTLAGFEVGLAQLKHGAEKPFLLVGGPMFDFVCHCDLP